MKSNDQTLHLTKRNDRAEQPLRERLSLLIAAVPVFLGLWGMVQNICPIHKFWVVLGLCAVVLAVCFSWCRQWQRITLLALCASGVLLCFVGQPALTQGLAALANGIGTLLTEKTGNYFLPFACADMNGLTAARRSVLLGGLAAAAMRAWRGIPHVCCALGVLFLVVCG